MAVAIASRCASPLNPLKQVFLPCTFCRQQAMLRKYLHQWAESSNKEGLSGIRSEKSGAEAVKSKATASKDDKVLHLVRHGVTEMNVFLGSAPQGFTDPLMYDTRLTPAGREQARSVNKKVAELGPIDLIVTSPLTRAMDTMQLAFAGVDAPKVVCELARERLWMASDIGRHPSDLLLEYPALDFSALADIWWHTDGKGDPLAIFPESPEIFRARVALFKEWLAARPERTIAVVSHWGILYSLTGKDFENCELHTCRLSDLKHIYLT